jgi:hypothetical protein
VVAPAVQGARVTCQFKSPRGKCAAEPSAMHWRPSHAAYGTAPYYEHTLLQRLHGHESSPVPLTNTGWVSRRNIHSFIHAAAAAVVPLSATPWASLDAVGQVHFATLQRFHQLCDYSSSPDLPQHL